MDSTTSSSNSPPVIPEVLTPASTIGEGNESIEPAEKEAEESEVLGKEDEGISAANDEVKDESKRQVEEPPPAIDYSQS
jgi:hypothetical protein